MCVTIPNFITEISRFLNFIIFLNFKFVTVRTVKKGRTASPCQILSKSLNPRPRYGDLSNFQNGGRRHFGFLKLTNF